MAHKTKRNPEIRIDGTHIEDGFDSDVEKIQAARVLRGIKRPTKAEVYGDILKAGLPIVKDREGLK